VVGSVVVIGGSNGETAFADVWRYDLHTNEWISVSTSGATPGIRSGHSIIYQPSASRIVMFGGQKTATSFFRDVWTLDCSQ
jgi:N-acetylneuraminic acid mutarotase